MTGSRRIAGSWCACAVVGVVTPVVLTVAPGPTAASAAGRTTSWVSTDTTGTRGGGDLGAISADGSTVVFVSPQPLAAGSGGGRALYAKDLGSGRTSRLVVLAPGDGGQAALSTDGSRVVVVTGTALVPDDTNHTDDVYRLDRRTGTVDLVSRAPAGGAGAGASYAAAISGDGRSVAFSSQASNLVPDDTDDEPDVFVRDLVTGTTVRANVSPGGGQSIDGSGRPSLSADGRQVAFVGVGRLSDGALAQSIFVRDLVTGVTRTASVAPQGESRYLECEDPSLSGDGTRVAFTATRPPDDSLDSRDVYVRDLRWGTTQRVSASATGGPATAPSGRPPRYGAPVLSRDGGSVAFSSNAVDLVPGDTNGRPDVFVRHLPTGRTTRGSLTADGRQLPGGVNDDRPVSLSAAGRFVTFVTADALAPADANGTLDVYLRDRFGG